MKKKTWLPNNITPPTFGDAQAISEAETQAGLPPTAEDTEWGGNQGKATLIVVDPLFPGDPGFKSY